MQCDVSIEEQVFNEKMVCPYKSEWVTFEWKGRRTMCPCKGEGCVHTNSVEVVGVHTK